MKKKRIKKLIEQEIKKVIDASTIQHDLEWTENINAVLRDESDLKLSSATNSRRYRAVDDRPFFDGRAGA